MIASGFMCIYELDSPLRHARESGHPPILPGANELNACVGMTKEDIVSQIRWCLSHLPEKRTDLLVDFREIASDHRAVEPGQNRTGGLLAQ
jgi:hypothetical protein